jgi:hypothetical protein
MIEGLAITPPILGRIAIGKVVERNGTRLPEKDDEFTVTSLVQNREGWVRHPLDECLRKATTEKKLCSLPVRLLFADPDLNLRAQYTAFNRSNGRTVCAGNGQTCKRSTGEGLTSHPCPTPEHCAFGTSLGCKPYARLNVQIEGQDDALGSFIFRTTGYNSIRTLAARLSYFHALAGDALSCLPLSLKLRAKSTTQSHRAAVYFVDLVVREGITLEAALLQARQEAEARRCQGWNQAALEQAAASGLANGAFEDTEDEAPALIEEFFAEPGSPGPSATTTRRPSAANPGATAPRVQGNRPSLTDKLHAKATAQETPASVAT